MAETAGEIREFAERNRDFQGKLWTCGEKPGVRCIQKIREAPRAVERPGKSEKHPGLRRDPGNQRSARAGAEPGIRRWKAPFAEVPGA